MSKYIKRIEFDYMWEGDKEEQKCNMAQLKFPYFSPEDKGPKVIFRNDSEINHKMRKVRLLNKADLQKYGLKLLQKYDEEDVVDVLAKMLKEFSNDEE